MDQTSCFSYTIFPWISSVSLSQELSTGGDFAHGSVWSPSWSSQSKGAIVSREWGWWGWEEFINTAYNQMAGPQPASNSGNTFIICVSSNMIDKPSLRCYEINSKRVVHLLNKYFLSICFMLLIDIAT